MAVGLIAGCARLTNPVALRAIKRTKSARSSVGRTSGIDARTSGLLMAWLPRASSKDNVQTDQQECPGRPI